MAERKNFLTVLRRKILLYSVVYALSGFVLISAVSIWPLMHILHGLEEDNLLHAARSRALAVEEYLSRVSEITLQITSRSMLRRSLVRYNLGEIPLAELRAIIAPIMTDALDHSIEVAGIATFDKQGELVARVGLPTSNRLGTTALHRYDRAWISDPLVINDTLYVLCRAPILTPQGVEVGTDLVLFTTNKLQRIIWDDTGLGPRGECLLGRKAEDGVIIFFPGRMGERESYNTLYWQSPLGTAMFQAVNGQTGLLRYHGGELAQIDIVAHAPIHDIPWGLLVTMDEEALFGQINRQLLSIGGILFLLTASGAIGMLLLMRPLTGKVLVYSSELEKLNRDLKQEVTERERTAENLRRREKEWEQTFEAITDAVAIMDTRGRILKMNQATSDFLKTLLPEVRGAHACHIFFGLEREHSNCPFTRMLEEKTPQSGELYEPGSDRYFQINVYPLLDDQGQLWGGVHVATDVTEQKKMEKLKDEMISAVSHEMRTPLTAMLGFVEFLIENEVEREQQLDFLRTVFRETERLSELISNFLDLQRLQADIETYHFAPMPIHDLLNEAGHIFLVASKKHEVTVNCPEDLPPVHADEKRLLQVLKNLISNAIKYSPEGGDIVLSAKRSGKVVIISVEDQGMGIPPEALSRIFERFYRVDDSEKRIPGGIGLGLTLVREVVRAHGGRIWVESVYGEGSVFSFSVPVWEEGDEVGRDDEA